MVTCICQRDSKRLCEFHTVSQQFNMVFACICARSIQLSCALRSIRCFPVIAYFLFIYIFFLYSFQEKGLAIVDTDETTIYLTNRIRCDISHSISIRVVNVKNFKLLAIKMFFMNVLSVVQVTVRFDVEACMGCTGWCIENAFN